METLDYFTISVYVEYSRKSSRGQEVAIWGGGGNVFTKNNRRERGERTFCLDLQIVAFSLVQMRDSWIIKFNQVILFTTAT